MSGEAVVFIGDAMASVVQAIREVEQVSGQRAVVVGGLAVLCRLTSPYRATTDLDVVDGGRESPPLLQVLRQVPGADAVLPEAVMLPTAFGPVRVDVLTVRQVELDEPSSDAGDRLHASSHDWAHTTATEVVIEVQPFTGPLLSVAAAVAEPGPLVAMKLQALMDRGAAKRGTDLQDLVRLVLDPVQRPLLLDQIRTCDDALAGDIALHVRHWLVAGATSAVRAMRATGGDDLSVDDVTLVAELLLAAASR